MYKRIKVKTLVAAIRKNGYPKAQNVYSDGVAYCAFGQAGMNLKLSASALHVSTEHRYLDLAHTIIQMNDKTTATMPEIADEATRLYPDLMDKYIVIKY